MHVAYINSNKDVSSSADLVTWSNGDGAAC